jgi:hypothetical protein
MEGSYNIAQNKIRFSQKYLKHTPLNNIWLLQTKTDIKSQGNGSHFYPTKPDSRDYCLEWKQWFEKPTLVRR